MRSTCLLCLVLLFPELSRFYLILAIIAANSQQWFPTTDMAFGTKVKVNILRMVTLAEAHAYCFWSHYFSELSRFYLIYAIIATNSQQWFPTTDMTFDTKVKVKILSMVTLAEAHTYCFCLIIF